MLFVIAPALGAAAGAVATWLACRWSYGRKLLAAANRLHKADQGRLFSQQQTTQARQQIESLKAELAHLLHKKSVGTAQSTRDEQVARQIKRELEQEMLDAAMPEDVSPRAPAHGFADTQILP